MSGGSVFLFYALFLGTILVNCFSSSFTLGILGGGQLGKMLLYDTRKWDIATHTLDPDPAAPARFGTNRFTVGSLLDEATVYEFGKTCEVVTIEIENVSLAALERLEREGVAVYPPPAALRIIQDKTVQKEFYRTYGFPTAPFVVVENRAALEAAVSDGRIALPFVWKAARFGYDGKGVCIVRTPADFATLLATLEDGVPMLIEELVAMQKELAVVVARTPTGETATYPVVEMAFHGTANLVETVGCPADISPLVDAMATELATELAARLGIVGLLAVEMFLTTEGKILINEVAPRPHNSGHLTIEACRTGQFEQHLRAVLGLPLGSTELTVGGAVMLNLVGAEGYRGAVRYEGMAAALNMAGVTPHIYGKAETRPFRKMGHVTVTAENLAAAYQKAAAVARVVVVKGAEEG